jgi:hypothetical protein
MTKTSSMFCPLCGAQDQQAKAYCKRCGEWLPDMKAKSRMTFGGETPQQNLFISLFMSVLSAAVALFSAIALYATYLGSNEIKWSIYLAAAFCLCIAGWQISSFFATLKLKKRLGQGRETPRLRNIEAVQQRSALGPANLDQFVGADSVTDRTTELLDPVRPPETVGRREQSN